jgi:hypothetical protein
MNIYLIPPHGVVTYGKVYCEGVYGESAFTASQMNELVRLGCATWFDTSSPHLTSEVSSNTRPLDYIGPVHTILSRVEVWGIDWFTEDIQRELRVWYPLLSPIFQRLEKRP